MSYEEKRAELSLAYRRACSCDTGGIGTLSEKLIHKTLKYYLEPDDNCHEVKCSDFVADIMKDGRIIEIQSASFQYLARKLKRFLPIAPVTLVCPIQHTKYISTRGTYGVVQRKKSPRCKGLSDVAIELYKIKEFLGNESLTVKLFFLEIEAEREIIEGKARPKYKKGISYPTALLQEITLKCIDDYSIFLPHELDERFTAKDYYRSIGARAKFSYYSLKLCEYLGFLKAVGKSGNAIIYERNTK